MTNKTTAAALAPHPPALPGCMVTSAALSSLSAEGLASEHLICQNMQQLLFCLLAAQHLCCCCRREAAQRIGVTGYASVNAMVQRAAKDLLRGGRGQPKAPSLTALPGMSLTLIHHVLCCSAKQNYKAEAMICYLGAQTCLRIRQEAVQEGLQRNLIGEQVCCCCKLCHAAML